MTKFNPLKRLKIIKFISNFSEEYHRCPTIKEIAKGCGYRSLSGVHEQLVNLGFSGIKGVWSNNKKDILKKYICLTCGKKMF